MWPNSRLGLYHQDVISYWKAVEILDQSLELVGELEDNKQGEIKSDQKDVLFIRRL